MADILFAPVTGAVTERVRCPHIACDAPHAQKGENPGPIPGVTFTYEIERDFGGDGQAGTAGGAASLTP